ncbi:MAG: FprA family A-type flavoprotein [Fibrobacterota bacterium]
MYKAKEIAKGIYWVGVIDWNLRNFHGYLTQRGSTYNAYLIVDEKITLIDNVKSKFNEEFLERISSVVAPADIDIVIQNHVEMDHSGSLPELLKHCPNAEIYASAKGVSGLKEHYRGNFNYRAVKAGEELSTGSRTITFIPTPMVHWPDNMVCYLGEEQILFSNDSFGQHIASSERFDDELPLHITMEETAKYYANIVMPYSRQVKKELTAVQDYPIKMVCPSHGLIWRKNIAEVVKNYSSWAHNKGLDKALIVYDTMWGSTEQVAHMLGQAFEEAGIHVDICSVQHTHRSDIMTKLLSARFICAGSPTLNNNMLPTMAAFLTYLKGLSPKDRVAMAFGSYGWGGQGVKLVENELEACGFDLMDPVNVKFVPDEETLKEEKDNMIEQVKQKIREKQEA